MDEMDEHGPFHEAYGKFLLDRKNDHVVLDRALAILHRFATEQTGWRAFFSRWYYNDEPLRNDAANLVRSVGFGMPMPRGTRLVGDLEK